MYRFGSVKKAGKIFIYGKMRQVYENENGEFIRKGVTKKKVYLKTLRKNQMKSIGEANIVNSMDIIEVNPLFDVKNTTAELAIEMLIAAFGGSFGDYERNYLKIHGKH